MKSLKHPDKFVDRHIGPRESEIQEMLKTIGANSVDDLIQETIPQSIRLSNELKLDPPLNEHEFINHLREIADKNKVYNPTLA